MKDTILFVGYPKCSTSNKAKKWLDEEITWLNREGKDVSDQWGSGIFSFSHLLHFDDFFRIIIALMKKEEESQ